jgi:signal transduction histidine kinase
MAKAAGLRCRLELPLEVPELELNAEFRHNLFLAAKETLHNVVRHGHATEVRVRLECDAVKHRLKLIIRDDGVGFDASALKPDDAPKPGDRHGNGLPGLRRRLALLRGELRILSNEGSGTTVEFDVPLPPL